MTVKLTKIVNGELGVSDALTNGQTVKCPLCEQPFRLGYSDNEWNWVKTGLVLQKPRFAKTTKASTKLRLFR